MAIRSFLMALLLAASGLTSAQSHKGAWYYGAPYSCSLAAKRQVPEASWFRYKRVQVSVIGPTTVLAKVWFPGERTDWLAICSVDHEPPDKLSTTTLSVEPYIGPVPADRGYDYSTEYARTHRLVLKP